MRSRSTRSPHLGIAPTARARKRRRERRGDTRLRGARPARDAGPCTQDLDCCNGGTCGVANVCHALACTYDSDCCCGTCNGGLCSATNCGFGCCSGAFNACTDGFGGAGGAGGFGGAGGAGGFGGAGGASGAGGLGGMTDAGVSDAASGGG